MLSDMDDDNDVESTVLILGKRLLLKGLCHAIVGLFATDQTVIELTEISQ